MDGGQIVQSALNAPIGSPPLHVLARQAQRKLLITGDHTRPVPSHITIPAMLREVRRGNPNASIKILAATGMHRQTTRRELEEKLTQEAAAGEVSVRANHCAALIQSPLSRTGILKGNPIHRDMEAAARMAGLRASGRQDHLPVPVWGRQRRRAWGCFGFPQRTPPWRMPGTA